jgi:hypothetical protein
MKTYKIDDMIRGWFIGNFEPNAFKTSDVEVGFRIHKKDEQYELHYQTKVVEVNLLVHGKMIMHGKELNSGDIFIIYPYEITGGDVVVIKEATLQNKYPKAYKFLLTWRKKLLSRQKGKIKKDDWYKWGRIQSMIPVKNKLLTKTFNKGPCFYFDKTESLFSNGYALTNIHSSYNIKFIQLVLNSSIFAYYSKLTSCKQKLIE